MSAAAVSTAVALGGCLWRLLLQPHVGRLGDARQHAQRETEVQTLQAGSKAAAASKSAGWLSSGLVPTSCPVLLAAPGSGVCRNGPDQASCCLPATAMGWGRAEAC